MLLLLLVLVPALHEFFRPHEPELRANEDVFEEDYDPDPDKGIVGSDYNYYGCDDIFGDCGDEPPSPSEQCDSIFEDCKVR